MTRPAVTLAEVAVVLGVGAVILGGVGLAGWAERQDARLGATLASLRSLRDAVRLAERADGAWPARLDDLRGRWLRATEPLTSPWGTPYGLSAAGGIATVSVDVPLSLPPSPPLDSWVEAVPAAPGWTRLQARVIPAGDVSRLLVERRRVAGPQGARRMDRGRASRCRAAQHAAARRMVAACAAPRSRCSRFPSPWPSWPSSARQSCPWS